MIKKKIKLIIRTDLYDYRSKLTWDLDKAKDLEELAEQFCSGELSSFFLHTDDDRKVYFSKQMMEKSLFMIEEFEVEEDMGD